MPTKLLLLFTLVFCTCVRAQTELPLRSTLESYDLETRQRTVVYQEEGRFEAPNWSPDGKYLLINGDGKLFKIMLDSVRKVAVPVMGLTNINNDHGISKNGREYVISNSGEGGSKIYTVADTGGTPRLVTPLAPSYWHGWSPDGKRLAYTAQRDDNYDIYSIGIGGGEEQRLTDDPALDDGPDYSPDGRYIYYNSFASDTMEIWRMRADGSKKEQLTRDGYSNWFPHPSPNGKKVLFISYLQDQGQAHPAMKAVAIRIYDVAAGSVETLAYLTGGQGSINVPSWSPDGKKFAFVSYKNFLR